MNSPMRILLQTTLDASTVNDWTIHTFSLLAQTLASMTDAQGQPLFEVVARDRNPDASGHDPVLTHLNTDEFNQLWLFALDVGSGLTDAEQTGILYFHRQGGGILTTRDHQDMGISMCGLDHIGEFHYFHTAQCDPDPARCCRDDTETLSIDWPNYHSGANGDYQTITPIEPIHPLLKSTESPDGVIRLFPAHPHEGGIGVPEGAHSARVIATGVSKLSGKAFNVAIASEHTRDPSGFTLGRMVAQSTFHHFVDYNWDISKGCPTFVEEPPGNGMATHPQALNDIHAYVKNVALWLAGKI
jgi:hypothetical protein